MGQDKKILYSQIFRSINLVGKVSDKFIKKINSFVTSRELQKINVSTQRKYIPMVVVIPPKHLSM